MTDPELLHIRPMTEDDVDAVIAIERESEGAPHWGRVEYMQAIHNETDAALHRLVLVAEHKDRLAGFTVVRLLDTPSGGEAEIESIVVSMELRGLGIGATLLTELIRRARAHGALRLDLEVRASNAAAIRLYKRSGLVETGLRKRYYQRPDEDAVLMRMNL